MRVRSASTARAAASSAAPNATGLTPRPTSLLRLGADGPTHAQIARRLGLSDGTVRTHLENIYSRLRVSSRSAAILRAFPGPEA